MDWLKKIFGLEEENTVSITAPSSDLAPSMKEIAAKIVAAPEPPLPKVPNMTYEEARWEEFRLNPGDYAPHPNGGGIVHKTAEVSPLASVSAHAIIGPHSRVLEGANIDAYVCIGAGVWVGKGATLKPYVTAHDGVEIGEGAKIGEHTTLSADSRIGQKAVLQAKILIGVGTMAGEEVEIGNDVRIGAQTKIGAKTKIHPSTMIGEEVVIGREVSAGMRTPGVEGDFIPLKIGKGCVIGDNATMSYGMEIGSGCQIGNKSQLTAATEYNYDYGSRKKILSKDNGVGKGCRLGTATKITVKNLAPDCQVYDGAEFTAQIEHPRAIVGNDIRYSTLTSAEAGQRFGRWIYLTPPQANLEPVGSAPAPAPVAAAQQSNKGITDEPAVKQVGDTLRDLRRPLELSRLSVSVAGGLGGEQAKATTH